MTRKSSFVAVFLLTTVVTSLVGSATEKTIASEHSAALPRVLLIGDSICGGYQKVVKRELEGKAEVVKNAGNAEYTGTGLEKIDQWLGDGKWDVIHFNWGLWDMYGWRYTKEERSPAMYEKRLEALVTRLEKTGAKLIWATTTPVCPGPEGTMLKQWKTELTITPAVERQYQDAALRVMKKHNVQVNDLHALVLPQLKKYSPAPDNVHFTGAGCTVLGKQVADAICKQLDTPAAASAAKGPVKIFLLSGQSNMTGRGYLGELDKPAADQQARLVRYIMEPKNVEKYKFLYSGPKKTDTGWTIRDDVFITLGEWPHLKPGQEEYSPYKKHGGLGPYYGGRGSRGFGPEFAIGHVLGDHYDETVLLVKVSFGGNSLAGNFRPPSSGGTVGDKYPLVIKAVRDAIDHLPEIVPGYEKQRGYELVGFLWNQGLSDITEPHASEYEKNLVNLINDLRKELKAPRMKTVVAVSGNWGWDLAELKKREMPQDKRTELLASIRKVTEAQLAISKRPEYKGNVATAETRDFWRPREEFGGHGTDTHWQANGESYWLIGEAMGREMVKLLNAKKD